jgi:hypothetical protein
MCVAINASAANVGAGLQTLPPEGNATTAPVITAFVATGGAALTLTLDGSGAATDYICIAFSAPQSSGRGFCKTFWQQTVVAASIGTPQILTDGYVAQFGQLISGQRLFYKFTPVNEYGVVGVPLIGFITVT